MENNVKYYINENCYYKIRKIENNCYYFLDVDLIPKRWVKYDSRLINEVKITIKNSRLLNRIDKILWNIL